MPVLVCCPIKVLSLQLPSNPSDRYTACCRREVRSERPCGIVLTLCIIWQQEHNCATGMGRGRGTDGLRRQGSVSGWRGGGKRERGGGWATRGVHRRRDNQHLMNLSPIVNPCVLPAFFYSPLNSPLPPHPSPTHSPPTPTFPHSLSA